VERTDGKAIILFDGVCNLCNGAVQFVIKRDRDSRFLFASLQSPFGQDVMKRFGLDPTALHSILLLEGGRLYQRSDAVLRISSTLNGWSFTKIFRVVPAFIRDGTYAFIARHRYRIFGKRQECMIPTADLKSKFLE
jgi:predicted DCC family thiol-disulfide oxidoreductase YuxK